MAESEKVHILLMEDDSGLARLLQKRLGRQGYLVDVARDGEEGLAMLDAGSYDMLILDQIMPGHTGLEVIRILAERGPLPPIIMVTGTGSEQIAVEAMKLGARDYIVKDVEGGYLDLVPTVIGQVLQQQRLIEEKQQALAELQARVGQQAILAELGMRALAGKELSALMDEAVQLTAEALQVEFCKILELLPDGEALLLRAGVGWQKDLIGQATISAGLDSQAGFTLLSSEPVIVNDLMNETRFSGPPLLYEHGVVSGVSVIIQGEERPYGVMGAHTSQRRQFTLDDANFLQAVANVLATAVQRKRAERELSESEARFRQFMENNPAMVFIKDSSGRYVFGNPAWASQFDKPLEELLGRTDYDLLLQETADLFTSSDRAVLTAGRAIQMEEYGADINGDMHWWRVIKFPLSSPSGETLVGGSAIDITAEKRAQLALERYQEQLEEEVAKRTRELREAQEQLVRREKLAVLGQLAGGIGHDLRNPLSVISSAAELLGTILSDPDETTQQCLDIIESEVNRAVAIINDLFNFARTREPNRQPVDVKVLVADVLRKQSLPENVSVTTDIPLDLPPAFVDSRQIEQVLINLITNAHQAMPDGGQIAISAGAPRDQSSENGEKLSVADHPSQIFISVTDTGTGISPEHMKKLFEPLFTTKTRGMGLGLATSRNLVEANGGYIEVESTLGKGSTFTVWLPTQEPPEQQG